MGAAEKHLRADLAASSDLAAYADAVCAPDVCRRLIDSASDRPALLVLLKEACGVKALGLRHRLVTHITAAATAAAGNTIFTPSLATVTPGTPSCRPAPPTPPPPPPPSTHDAQSTFTASMIESCEKLDGPLPFMDQVEQRMRATGEYWQIAHEYPGLHRVSAVPPIYLCEDLLSDDECSALIRCADPMLLRSKTDGGLSDQRTSRSTHLRKGTPPCPSLLHKLEVLTRKPVSHMEVPQVARYDEGQFCEGECGSDHGDRSPSLKRSQPRALLADSNHIPCSLSRPLSLPASLSLTRHPPPLPHHHPLPHPHLSPSPSPPLSPSPSTLDFPTVRLQTRCITTPPTRRSSPEASDLTGGRASSYNLTLTLTLTLTHHPSPITHHPSPITLTVSSPSLVTLTLTHHHHYHLSPLTPHLSPLTPHPSPSPQPRTPHSHPRSPTPPPTPLPTSPPLSCPDGAHVSQ